MKKILFILLLITPLYSQSYNCVEYYEGEVISKDSINWIEPLKSDAKLYIHGDTSITVIDDYFEQSTYSYILVTKLQDDSLETIYFSWDWEKYECFVRIEHYLQCDVIYFQYENMIWGYKIKKIKIK